MTADPDPQPEQTAGLEPGGGVPPGDTPPGEASTTSGVTAQQSDLPSGTSNAVVYGIVLALVGVAVLLFVGYALGLAG